MVTIEELKSQIAKEQKRIDDAKKKQKLEFEKSTLSKQLKVLKRSPGTTKNIEIAKRTGRGLARITKFAGTALVKQAKLIKEQQLREDAAFAKSQRKLKKKIKKGRKKLAKGSKKRSKTLSKKTGGKSFTIKFN